MAIRARKLPYVSKPSDNLPHTGNTAKDVAEDQFDRPEDFETRRPKQVNTHAFPTTSIGSFPQTAGGSHFTLYIHYFWLQTILMLIVSISRACNDNFVRLKHSPHYWLSVDNFWTTGSITDFCSHIRIADQSSTFRLTELYGLNIILISYWYSRSLPRHENTMSGPSRRKSCIWRTCCCES